MMTTLEAFIRDLKKRTTSVFDLSLQSKIFSPAEAYWNQRFELRSLRERIFKLFNAVDCKDDLSPCQWAQLMAAVLEFKPDLILELGRHYGNSTCAFTEAANHLIDEGHSCRVVSICLSDNWEHITQKRIEREVNEDWFNPLKAIRDNILTFDYESVFKGTKRCLIFWDAHGFDVAECVLGRILPGIVEIPNLVIMHDLSDARYIAAESAQYGKNGIWKRNDWSGPRVRIGNIDSSVEQAVAIVDFVSRNNIAFDSADHVFNKEIGKDSLRMEEMQEILGNELFSISAHWFWFTLNGIKETLTFPSFHAAVSQKCNEINILEQVQIVGVSLKEAVLSQPQLIQVIQRVNRYLKMDKTSLAIRIVNKELGHIRDSADILTRIKEYDEERHFELKDEVSI